MSAELKLSNLDRFADALAATLENERGSRGIGTLGEKTLHSVLKYYFEPNAANHEIKVRPFVADILNGDGITEIQTRAFDKLRKKLALFLELSPVTVVFPVVREKYLVWIDPETGEMTKKRKSPKPGRPSDALRELHKIREFIGHENLTICIITLDCEEYRLKNGYAEDGKRGSSRYERIPINLCEEIYLKRIEDYSALIPEGLGESFTAADFRRAVRFGGMNASFALKLLEQLGFCRQAGKKGRAYIYERT